MLLNLELFDDFSNWKIVLVILGALNNFYFYSMKKQDQEH